MFAVILGVAVFSGLRKGMIRIGIGVVASILGFLLASWFYGIAGGFLAPYIPYRGLANFLGFMIVFGSVMIAGSLLAAVVGKGFKLVGLSWLDRLAGGAIGLVLGLIICVVLMMVQLAFTPARPPVAITGSVIAPYVLESAKYLSAMTPHEIKNGFRNAYDSVQKTWSELHASKKKKMPVRQE
jgi:membrane protein required for colicin V production